MTEGRSRPLIKIVGFTLLFAAIFIVGMGLRTRDMHPYLAINTVTFFYERANYLHEHGAYRKTDDLTSAGRVVEEDYPPLLAYAAVASYRVASSFYRFDFATAIAYFPVLCYLLIFLVGSYMTARLFTLETGALFAALFSILPASVRLTSVGYYPSECLGVFFFFACFYYLILSADKTQYLWFAILSATLLALTWQLFIAFFLIILVLIPVECRSLRRLAELAILLTAPLVLAHIISRYLIGIEYSPFAVIRETVGAFYLAGQEAYKIALGRSDLRPMKLNMFLGNYGWLCLILIPFGFLQASRRLGEARYRTVFI